MYTGNPYTSISTNDGDTVGTEIMGGYKEGGGGQGVPTP